MEVISGTCLREAILSQLETYSEATLPIPREYVDAYRTAQDLIRERVVDVAHQDSFTVYLTLAA